MMKTADFDYKFPEELIAHQPAAVRDQSRLMVLHHKNRIMEHKRFCDILGYLKQGDLLVLNDTKVIPANLIGSKVAGGARVEVLLVSRRPAVLPGQEIWLCLVKPGKRLQTGSEIVFGQGKLKGTVLRKLPGGEQVIEFEARDGNFWESVHELGDTPLPPYIKAKRSLTEAAKTMIRDRYQTVYASAPGASAAPTAGLHFTPELLDRIRAKGVKIAYLTLHTGLATFQPVRSDTLHEHKMHSEYFEIPPETVEAVGGARRVIAVGTTAVRALETMAHRGVTQGSTDLFIYPGFDFKVVKGLITNFHWPRSTLVMLVAALAGRDFVMQAYQEAIREQYRLFSFGDAMLVI